MKVWLLRFNLYFLTVALGFFCGCKSTPDDAAGKKKKDKELSTLRLHLEVNPDETTRTASASVYRANPILIGIWRLPFLDEGSLQEAKVVDVPGGFAIQLQFDDPEGMRLLEMATTAHKGKHIVIQSAFPDIRWLAAPQITQRIANGILVFTPDANREETERIVLGLNNMAAKIKKTKKKKKND